MRRVVITGVGAVSPLANGAEATWERLIRGESGLKTITGFDTSDLPAHVAGQIPCDPAVKDYFNADDYVALKDQRKMDRFIVYGIAAATQAIQDAGWHPTDEEEKERTGVIIGSGIGGLSQIYDTSLTLNAQGPRRVSPFFIPACLINLVSGHVSIQHGFKGPNHAVGTACSTGAHAIGDASRLIQFGDADVMVAGGTEAAICRIGMAGFAAARALSTNFNDTPKAASRPWDRDRDGFVMGEGSAILILEEYNHAKQRGAKIYAEIVGYGLSGDAYHITAPAEDGDGAFRAMRQALRNAKLNPEDIDYINAHGTSTPLGDVVETRALKRLFGDHAKKLAVSSTKSSIGHLLGAAGSIEALFCALALRDNVMPPTLNLDNPSEECDLNFIPHQAQERPLNIVMSNSFGFGGTNACLILRRV